MCNRIPLITPIDTGATDVGLAAPMQMAFRDWCDRMAREVGRHFAARKPDLITDTPCTSYAIERMKARERDQRLGIAPKGDGNGW